jgi:FlaA1/EpsC-like NDP-sugar epimerase
MPKFLYKNFYIIFFIDAMLVAFSWYFAHALRFNFSVPVETAYLLWRLIPLIIIIKLISFYFFDLYQGMWRYTSLSDVTGIFKACCVSSVVMILLFLLVRGISGFSRSIFIIDWGLTFFLIAGTRMLIRFYFWLGVGDEQASLQGGGIFRPLFRNHRDGKRLLIIGAGDCGEKICREIHENTRLVYKVLGFLDDDPLKLNRRIHGIPVLGSTENIEYFAKELAAEEILIAMPSLTSKEMKAMITRCEGIGVPFKTVPGMGELINGKVSIKTIRDVSYRDLLGREQVNPSTCCFSCGRV